MRDIPTFYRDAHRHSSRHRAEVERSDVCGCFYCRRTFAPSDITAWVGGDTASCPRCGIDAVIGSASGYSIDAAFLNTMHELFFG